jgi:hypothetical protein
MLVKYANWRTEVEIEEINFKFDFTEYDQVLYHYQHNYHGVCKIGRPVYIERTGLLNSTELFKVTTMERM